MKITLLTHMFNEEYLLPFWLLHHKDMFDELIVVDYRSTDNSIDICRRLWPGCRIVPTENDSFDAENIDLEMMKLEQETDGIKIILNTTEFLFIEGDLEEIFHKEPRKSISIEAISPYTKQSTTPSNLSELWSHLLDDDVVYHYDRGTRQIHNFPHGNYTMGRHGTHHPTTPTNQMHIVWLGFYPLNEPTLQRKLQIQHHIPLRDKTREICTHHLCTREQLLSKNEEKVRTGIPLKVILPSLIRLLNKV